MINLSGLNILASGINHLRLNWDFQSTAEDLNDYELEIYRSESPGLSGLLTGFEIVASGISMDVNTYADFGISGLYDPNRN